MTRRFPFLTARWQELSLLNYSLEPAFLAAFLPAGLAPDLLQGRAYCSLVAFDFLKVRVLGLPWPEYTSFPEWNLRVYVRAQESGERGVLFIRELIPGKIPCWIARTLYKEPYSACPMVRRTQQHPDGAQTQTTEFLWRSYQNSLRLKVGPETLAPPPGSPEDWFKEQEWGFGEDHAGELLRYRVTHPRWLLRRVAPEHTQLKLEWRSLYGPVWAQALSGREPDSVIHAIGSEITVYSPETVPRWNYH